MTWSPSTPRKVTECTPLDTRGPKRLWDAPAGWVTRDRGTPGGTRTLEFLCPVHGRFTVDVPRGQDPDNWPCPAAVGADDDCTVCGGPNCACTDVSCGESSSWSPSTFGIWASPGEVTS